MALVLESTSDSLKDAVSDISGGVVEVEVFTTGLSNNSRVASVLVEVGGNVLPERLEDVSRSGKVETGKLSVLNALLDNVGRRARDELDHAWGETSLKQELVGKVVGIGTSRGWLPNGDVAHDGGSKDEVTSDSSKVERSNSEDESLERSVFDPVPDTRAVLGRLDLEELLDVLYTEPEEIGHFGGSVNLGLPGVLSLSEHGGGHQFKPVLATDKVGGLEEDGSLVSPRHVLPSLLGGQ